MKLYLGAADGPLHQQHRKVMGKASDWVFVDKYVDNGVNKLWDAETLEEVEDGTVEAIYNSHLAEHISHRRIKQVIDTWHRKLKPGGWLYINVPDLEWACRNFLNVLQNERAGLASKDYYRYSINPNDYEHDFIQIFYGSHENDGEYHKNGFTQESLKDLLKNFSQVEIWKEFEAHEIGCLLAKAIK